MFPPNPATTNIPNKPLFDFGRSYSGLKNSLGRVYDQLPDVRGAIQPPVSPLTQGAQQSPIAAALSGPGPGSDASRLTAPTQGGFPQQPPSTFAPGRNEDFSAYQPSQQMPGDASQLGMRNPLPAPGMDVPGSAMTPEGTLADRIAGMSMQPDPAYVQEQMEAAKALGEQRYGASDVGRMQAGRMADMTANRNMGQMAGGNYGDMDPARAAASSQAMYRNAGTGGGLGGASMGAREDALEQAERANPPGPSYQQRFQNSSQEMRSIAEALQPGQTVSSTSADGTPMLASRGNAQARASDDPIRLAQQDTNRRIRQERNEGLRNAGQMRLARNAAMQEAAANPENSPFFQALMMQNPHGAAAITQARAAAQAAQGEIQMKGRDIDRLTASDQMKDKRAGEELGILDKEATATAEYNKGLLAQTAARDVNAFSSETERLRQAGLITEAEVTERNEAAELARVQREVIEAASDPEAMKAAQREAERMAVIETGQAGEHVDDIMAKPGETGGARTADGSYPPLKPPKEAGPTGEVTDADIGRRLNQLSVNDGLEGESLINGILESGIDMERLKRYAQSNPSSFVSRALAITFSLPWNWASEYDRVNEQAAPMISLEDALRGMQSGSTQAPAPPQNFSMIGNAQAPAPPQAPQNFRELGRPKPRENFKELGRPKPRENFKELGSNR